MGYGPAGVPGNRPRELKPTMLWNRGQFGHAERVSRQALTPFQLMLQPYRVIDNGSQKANFDPASKYQFLVGVHRDSLPAHE